MSLGSPLVDPWCTCHAICRCLTVGGYCALGNALRGVHHPREELVSGRRGSALTTAGSWRPLFLQVSRNAKFIRTQDASGTSCNIAFICLHLWYCNPVIHLISIHDFFLTCWAMSRLDSEGKPCESESPGRPRWDRICRGSGSRQELVRAGSQPLEPFRSCKVTKVGTSWTEEILGVVVGFLLWWTQSVSQTGGYTSPGQLGQPSRPGVYPVLRWSDCWDAKAFQVNSVGWFVGTFLV